MKEYLYLEQHYKAKQVSKEYKVNQVNAFKKFEEYCRELNLSIKDLSPAEAHSYLEYLTSTTSRLGIPYSNSRINELLNAVQRYYSIQVQNGIITRNPFDAIKKLPISKFANSYGANALSFEEVKELFEATETMREKVILHLFYSFGFRRKEAQEIILSDINFHANTITIRNGKGGKSRTIEASKKVFEDIKDYVLNERTELLNGKESDALIVSRLSKKNTGDTMYKQVLKITERTTITKKVVPHVLRASLATHYLMNGVEPEIVQAILAHTSLDTTTIYTVQR